MSNDVHTSVNTDKLFSMLKSSGKSYDLEKIQKAYDYAAKLHEGQFRNSGDPYISHPIAVAEIVASLGLDTDSICAAFLHDTVEDCPDKTNLGILRSLFGESVAMLVDGLTKLENINIQDKEEAQMENIRKMHQNCPTTMNQASSPLQNNCHQQQYFPQFWKCQDPL